MKSSHSGHNGGDCIEIAPGIPGVVPVRDSKRPNGPILTFTPATFQNFITAVRSEIL
ncbi:DUF397 domain-containing protein [Streptomyces sp. NPDC003077]|uniref:DUF397 domain-containing protein n=1 Tax=Streptomyces sp. NPDC003077 TaxID=3154443 RepID=UPI0033AA4836